MSAPATAPPLDGRLNRALRSRRAICDACLDLVQEGVLQPSADQIADRAGVSRRSIFYHFSDLAALYDASDDWVPIYDKSSLPGFYMACATSGNQFKNAPLAGQFLRALVDAVEGVGAALIDELLLPSAPGLKAMLVELDRRQRKEKDPGLHFDVSR